MPEDTKAKAAREAVKDAANEELAVRTEPTLRELVAKQEDEIARALPNTMDPARYVRIVQSELSKNPKLREATPRSFIGAVLTAAQLGLEFGPLQQAFILPFKKKRKEGNQWLEEMEAQLIIGYRGWMSLMNRSAEIADVSARTVYSKDFFEYEYGLDERLVHRPASGDRGAPTGYYAVIRKTNGGRTFAYMTKEEVEKHRDRYASNKYEGTVKGPWADPDQFEQMAWKTVFLRAKTWVPVSVDQQLAMHTAEGVDNHVVRRMTVDEEPDIEPFEEGESEVVEGEIVDADGVPIGETAWDREDREARERGQS